MAWFDARIDLLSAQERQLKSATRPGSGLFAQGYYGYPGLDFFRSMISPDWTWNALVGVRMSWNFGGYYTRKNSLNKLRAAKEQIEVKRDIFPVQQSVGVRGGEWRDCAFAEGIGRR